MKYDYIMQYFDYDLSNLIANLPNSDLTYGEEFRLSKSLEKLLHKHANCKWLK